MGRRAHQTPPTPEQIVRLLAEGAKLLAEGQTVTRSPDTSVTSDPPPRDRAEKADTTSRERRKQPTRAPPLLHTNYRE